MEENILINLRKVFVEFSNGYAMYVHGVFHCFAPKYCNKIIFRDNSLKRNELYKILRFANNLTFEILIMCSNQSEVPATRRTVFIIIAVESLSLRWNFLLCTQVAKED